MVIAYITNNNYNLFSILWKIYKMWDFSVEHRLWIIWGCGDGGPEESPISLGM
jgi:hypothetical protein